MVSDLTFGLFFSVIFFIISLIIYNFFEESWLLYLFTVFTFFFIFLSIFKPVLLYHFKLGWYNLGVIIGLFITPIIFGIFYYVILTPFGLIARISNKNNDYNFIKKNTYWNISKNKKNDFRKQF